MIACSNPLAAFKAPGRLVLYLALAVTWLATACGDDNRARSQLETQLQPGRTADAFSLKILDGSIFDEAEIALELAEQADTAEAVVKVSQGRAIKAIYLELTYDSQQWSPTESTGGRLLEADECLELTAEPAPGRLHHGQVLANWPEHAGVSGSGVLARFSFARRRSPAPRGAAEPVKQAAAVPQSPQAQHYLNFNPASSVFLWYYVNPGDYDQNGEVGITDLTPLGANFNAEGPFGVTSARTVIDGDGNGVINIADITPIGLNFGNQIDSFTVFGSASGSDYPDSAADSNGAGARQIGTRPFSAAGGGGALRKYWELVLAQPVIGTGYYWQRPVFDGAQGTPSQLAAHTQSWHTQELFDYDGEPSDASSLTGVDIGYFNGSPVVVLNLHRNGGIARFTWFQAADAGATAWESPRTMFDISWDNYGARLASIDGVPALCWFHFANGNLMFNRATDATGQSWTVPVVVDDYIDAGFSNRLLAYDGRPAIVFSNGAQQVNICVAEDAGGTSWTPREVIYSPARIGNFSAVALPGGIGVLAEDDDTAAMLYSFVSIDGSAVSPSAPQTIFEGNTGSNSAAILGVAGGIPHLFVYRTNASSLYGSYGLDATGGSWVVPAPLALSGGSFGLTGSCVAYGVPWLVYHDAMDGIVRAAYSAAPEPVNWNEADNIDESSPLINGLVLRTAGIHPAVAYYDSATGIVTFSMYY